jgi:hypothetical protein
VALADAVKAMNMFLLDQINIPILGVVENMAWFTPAELPDNKYYIFGERGGKNLAKMSKSVLLGQIPLVQSVREGGDTGKPAITQPDNPAAAAFLEVAKNTLRQVGVLRGSLILLHPVFGIFQTPHTPLKPVLIFVNMRQLIVILIACVLSSVLSVYLYTQLAPSGQASGEQPVLTDRLFSLRNNLRSGSPTEFHGSGGHCDARRWYISRR